MLITTQVQRAIHIHVQVHTNWTVQSNGTLLHGSIVSTGQIFADETISQEIMALEPYASHTQIERVKNDADGIYTHESASKYLTKDLISSLSLSPKLATNFRISAGAMTVMDTEPLDGVDNKNGVFGYITLVSYLSLK